MKDLALKRRQHRWTGYKYDSLLRKSGLTEYQAQRLAGKLFTKMRQRGLSEAAVVTYNLDNPYMTEDARKCIINYHRRVLRTSASTRSKPKVTAEG